MKAKDIMLVLLGVAAVVAAFQLGGQVARAQSGESNAIVAVFWHDESWFFPGPTVVLANGDVWHGVHDGTTTWSWTRMTNFYEASGVIPVAGASNSLGSVKQTFR